MEIIAPEYFERGEASLEAACHDIDQWLPPLPGPLTLPLHGNLIKVSLNLKCVYVIILKKWLF